MKTSKDLALRSETLTCEELVDANIPFVRGVIYEADLPEAKYVTPVHTFNGWAADCYPVRKGRGGFEYDKALGDYPIPVKCEYLGEPVAVITEGGAE